MPRGDRTGPAGMGPMTGRGAGYCSGSNAPGFTSPMPGFGFGRGFGRGWGRGLGRGAGMGRGFGWRWTAYAPEYQPIPPTKEQEMQIVEEDIRYLEAEQKEINTELDAARKRLDELKK